MDSRIKALFIVPIFEMANAGSENFAYRLLTSLPEDIFDIYVITNRGEPVKNIKTYKSVSNTHSIISSILPDIIIDWGFNYPSDIHRVGGGVHKYFLEYSLDAYWGPLRFYKKVRNMSLKNRLLIDKQMKMIRRKGPLFLPNSNFCAEQIRMAGAEPNSIRVLHNAVKTDYFRPFAKEKEAKELRRSWGFRDAHVVALFVAHNLLLKNLALLRKVIPIALKKEPFLRLVIVGKRRPKYMPDGFIYAGELSDMRACYQAADFLLHPSYFDSCSNVVFEAMSSGIPVVVSNRCGANELVKHGASGFVLKVTPSGSRAVKEAWLERILELCADKGLRLSMGQESRKAMMSNDFDVYVKTFMTFMIGVLEKKGHLHEK